MPGSGNGAPIANSILLIMVPLGLLAPRWGWPDAARERRDHVAGQGRLAIESIAYYLEKAIDIILTVHYYKGISYAGVDSRGHVIP